MEMYSSSHMKFTLHSKFNKKTKKTTRPVHLLTGLFYMLLLPFSVVLISFSYTITVGAFAFPASGLTEPNIEIETYSEAEQASKVTPNSESVQTPEVNQTSELVQASELVQDTISGILDYKMNSAGVVSLQELVSSEFESAPTDVNTQTYVLSIINDPYRSADFSDYGKALAASLSEVTSPTSLQKSLLTLYLTGSASLLSKEDAQTILTETIGAKGIMSYIYGLRMLDECHIENCNQQKEDIILTLLSMQLPDGGFSLSEDKGDIDVTAMALQALAPAYNSIKATDTSNQFYNYAFITDELSEALNLSVSAALDFLSKNQLATGDYSSYSSACSESTSQVIIALCKLNINPITSPDFIKNGNSVLDGLLIYQTSNGGFSHINGNVSNNMASAQALDALTELSKLLPEYKGHIGGLTTKNSSSNFLTPLKNSNIPIRLIIVGIILLISLIAITVFVIRRQNNRKALLMQIASILLIALVSSLLVWNIKIQSKTDFQNETSSVLLSPSEDAIAISFTISSETVNEKIIYSNKDLYVSKDATVFEVLKEICRCQDIQFDYESNGTYGLAYIKGIDSLYEFDYGDLSGWMYRVNNEFPSVGCGYYKLSAGDKVEWLYTTNLGRDLE